MENMKTCVPYLVFDGNCKEALEFYRDCFDGEIIFMCDYTEMPEDSGMKVADDKKHLIMHSNFKFFGGELMAADYAENAGMPPIANESRIQLNLGFDSVEELEECFYKIERKGSVVMPLADTFWGDRFGIIKDDFGIDWMFNCPLEK